MEDMYEVILTSDNSGVEHYSVGTHQALLIAPVQVEHLLPKHSLPCW